VVDGGDVDCGGSIVDCCGNDDVWNADTSCDVVDRAARMHSVVVSLIIFLYIE